MSWVTTWRGLAGKPAVLAISCYEEDDLVELELLMDII